MGIKDTFRNLVGLSEGDEVYDDEPEETEEGDFAPPKKSIKEHTGVQSSPDMPKSKNNVFNIASVSKPSSSSGTEPSIKLVKPKKFSADDVSDIADELKAKRMVLLNLEDTQEDDSRRILDFLAGVAYAFDGGVKPVGKDVFFIAPYKVNFDGDLSDYGDFSGVDSDDSFYS